MTINLSDVPNKLGVYLWKNKYNKVIYVGKSKNLNYSMNQYMVGNLTSKNEILLKNIHSFEYFLFDSELETLKFEQNLIDEYEPIFNIKVRSKKIYPYIEVKIGTKLKFTVSKTKKFSKAKYFGPFNDGIEARKIINLWINTFDINFNENIDTQNKILKSIENLYSGNFREAYSLLLSKHKKNKNVIEDLTLLRNLDLNTEILYTDKRSIDVINYFVYDDLISICVTCIRKGVKGTTINIINKLFNPYPEDALIAFLSRYYSRNTIPDKVIIPFEIKWNIGLKANILTPSEDLESKLLNETQLNAEIDIMNTVEKFMNKIKAYGKALEFIKKNSNTRGNSRLIEYIKIVDEKEYKFVTFLQYLEGRPRIRGYKKYVINKDETIYDVLTKHHNIKKNNNKIVSDITIVEGEEDLSLAAPFFEKDFSRSLLAVSSKDGNIIDSLLNDEEEIFDIEFNSHIYNFLSTLKRESDKFNKNYHRAKKTGMILETKLDKYKFLTEVDKQNLFKYFKSYKSIMNANWEELGKIITRTKVSRFLKERENKNG